MGNSFEVGKTGEFEDGSKKKVVAQGQEILLARVGDSYYAVSNRCPHMGGELSEGKLEGTVITCPRHGSQFELRDGKVVRWLKGSGLSSAVGRALKPPKPLNTYAVKVEGNTISVEI
jgi:3-phenylpropionate/trans-cinnamate dioxygenase ferredoxin subunit